jgi:hypothetical protein
MFSFPLIVELPSDLSLDYLNLTHFPTIFPSPLTRMTPSYTVCALDGASLPGTFVAITSYAG